MSLRNIAISGKEYLVQLQQKEAETTGISSLKIGFNNVFGYYLEVTNSHKTKVPAEWMRKQTLANAERYITPELKEYEEKITGAEEKILQMELQLFDRLLNELQDYTCSYAGEWQYYWLYWIVFAVLPTMPFSIIIKNHSCMKVMN